MPDVSDADRKAADSGFTPENIADAEWLWMNVNVDHRKFHELPTHHKALLCHTAARHREAGRLAGMEEAAVIADGHHVGLRGLNAFGRSSINTARKIAEEIRAAKGEDNG